MSEKFCIFCGKTPENKNLEHVIPQWLIRMTSRERKDVFSLHPDHDKHIPFIQFKFPACTTCNTKYAHMEALAKPVIEKVLAGQSISGSEASLLMDWFDKVRVGLWLTNMFYDKKLKHDVMPHFFIDSRVAKTDRMLSIQKLSLEKGEDQGLFCLFRAQEEAADQADQAGGPKPPDAQIEEEGRDQHHPPELADDLQDVVIVPLPLDRGLIGIELEDMHRVQRRQAPHPGEANGQHDQSDGFHRETSIPLVQSSEFRVQSSKFKVARRTNPARGRRRRAAPDRSSAPRPRPPPAPRSGSAPQRPWRRKGAWRCPPCPR